MVLRKTLFLIIPLVLLLAAMPVFGATLKGGEDVSIEKSQTITDDTYIAGGNVSVLGTVTKDLVSAGGNILLTGAVGGDAMAAGGSVQVLSSVGDDVRIAGGQIMVGDRVGGDVLVAGGDVKLLSGSAVGGDVIIAAGRVMLDGSIDGNVKIWAEELIITGVIGGDISFKGNKIVIEDSAKISGGLNYASMDEAEIGEGASILGAVVFDQKEADKKEKHGFGFFLALGGALLFGKILVTIVAAVAAVFLFRRFAVDVSKEAIQNFGKNSLLGFAVLVVTPIGLAVVAATFVGILIAGVGFGAYVLMLMFAKILSGIIAGGLLSKLIKKEIIIDWKWTVAGVFALQVVAFVPFVGWIVSLLAFIVTLGALATLAYKHFWLDR